MPISQNAIASATPFVQTSPLTSASAPSAPTLSAPSNSGSTLPAATYYVKITWVYSITYNGRTYSQETPASSEVSQAVASGQSLQISPPSFPSGVTAVNIYVSSTTGTETFQLQGTTTSTSYQISAPLSTTAKSPATSLYPNGNASCPTISIGNQVVYQAPAYSSNVTAPSSTAIIKEIAVTNTSSSSAWLSLWICKSDGSVAYTYLFSQTPVNANDSKALSGLNKMIPAGWFIVAAQQTAGALHIDISGVEIQ